MPTSIERYESEYQYLFERIYSAHNNILAGKSSWEYDIPNVARRLVESFLVFKYPHEKDFVKNLKQCASKLATMEGDSVRLERFLNICSHKDSVDLIGEKEPCCATLSEILKDTLLLIQQELPEHYCSMMKVINDENFCLGEECSSKGSKFCSLQEI